MALQVPSTALFLCIVCLVQVEAHEHVWLGVEGVPSPSPTIFRPGASPSIVRRADSSLVETAEPAAAPVVSTFGVAARLIVAAMSLGAIAVGFSRAGGPPLIERDRQKLVAVVVCAVYVVQALVVDILIARQHHEGEEGGAYGSLDPACAVALTEAVKLALSGLLFAGSRFRGAARSAWEEPPALTLVDVGWMALPACIFSANNILVWRALGTNDAATFAIFRDTVLLWTALFWRCIFCVEIGRARMASIVVVFAGLVLNKVGLSVGGEHWSWGFLWVLLLACTNSMGSVANEYVLKRTPQQDINLQNMLLYSMCLVFILSFVLMTDRGKLMSPAAFFQGFTSDTWLVISLQAMGGLLVSRMLKFADSITRTVAACLRGPLLVVVAPYFVASSRKPVTVVSSLIVAAGCCLYFAQGPLCGPAVEEPKKSAPQVRFRPGAEVDGESGTGNS